MLGSRSSAMGSSPGQGYVLYSKSRHFTKLKSRVWVFDHFSPEMGRHAFNAVCWIRSKKKLSGGVPEYLACWAPDRVLWVPALARVMSCTQSQGTSQSSRAEYGFLTTLVLKWGGMLLMQSVGYGLRKN